MINKQTLFSVSLHFQDSYIVDRDRTKGLGLVIETHVAEDGSLLKQYQKNLIHLSKNLVLRMRERDYFLFYIQPPKPAAVTLATGIYLGRSI
jgi:hypothetical protein